MKFPKIVLLFLPILFLLTSCQPLPELHAWESVETDQGTLMVKYADAPAFGPHTIHFYFWEDFEPDEIALGTTELNNDGANLGDANFEVLQAEDDLVIFELRGQQMQPEKWRLSFSDKNPMLEKME